MPARNTNLHSRIDDLVDRIRTLEEQLHAERTRSLLPKQRIRLARTINTSDYPEQDGHQSDLHGRFPIEFLDVGYEHSPGWWGPTPKTRKSTAEDYSVVAMHIAPNVWIPPGTYAWAFTQEPIESNIGEGEWFFHTSGGHLPNLGMLDSSLQPCSIGSLTVHEQVGDTCPTQEITGLTVRVINLTDEVLLPNVLMRWEVFARANHLVVFPIQLTDCAV